MLAKLGCDGNGVGEEKNALLCGFSTGSVNNFTKRVFTAILSLKDQVIKWPNAKERRQISRRFARDHGLPNAVGIIDGTPVVYSQRPHIDGEVFWTRKKEYSQNLQLVCDDRRKVRFFLIGWPGTVYDNTVFCKTKLARNPLRYFCGGQYILADSGYSLKSFVVTPYRQPLADIPENRVFNEYFSSARVIIEHVNGILKGRFSSLRGIRTQIREDKDFKLVNEHILVCLILHNLMIDFNDEWELEEEEGEEDEEEGNEEDGGLIIDEITGQEKRLEVQNKLLQWVASLRN